MFFRSPLNVSVFVTFLQGMVRDTRRGAVGLMMFLAIALPSNVHSEPASPLKLQLPKNRSHKMTAIANRMYAALQKQAHYLLATLHPRSDEPTTLILTESRSNEHHIRPNAKAAAAFAFLSRFGPYDPEVVGISREALLTDVCVPMMRYLVETHVTGSRPTSDGKPWGDAWKSGSWASALGRGAWWAWGELPADLREGMRRIVAHEAGRFVDAEPPHQTKRDTKSEENAWNSQILSVAAVLMPDDPRRPRWEAAFQKWALSAYLRPADAFSDEILDGKPLRQRLSPSITWGPAPPVHSPGHLRRTSVCSMLRPFSYREKRIPHLWKTTQETHGDTDSRQSPTPSDTTAFAKPISPDRRVTYGLRWTVW